MERSVVKETLQVTGMTCAHCEQTIEKALLLRRGVLSAKANFQNGTVQVTYNEKRITQSGVMDIIRQAGYGVVQSAKEEVLRRALLFVLIFLLFLIAEESGILNLLVPQNLADSSMGYVMLFLTGLLSSVHCIAMCGGINLSQSLSELQREKTRGRKCSALPASGGGASTFATSIVYNLSRIASYTFIGVVLGGIGFLLGEVFSSGVFVAFQGIFKMVAGTCMVFMGLGMLGIAPSLPVKRKKRSEKECSPRRISRIPMVVGLLNGFMPCGPLQAAELIALSSQNPLSGGLTMLCFGLGTLPLMLGLGAIVSILGRRFKEFLLCAGSLLVCVMGLSMLFQGNRLFGIFSTKTLCVAVFVVLTLCFISRFPFKTNRQKSLSLLLSSVLALLLVFGSASSEWSLISKRETLALETLEPSEDAQEEETVSVSEDTLVVESVLEIGSYPDIEVQQNSTVTWIIDAEEGTINGCNYRMIANNFGINHTFSEGENVITFTTGEPGVYTYSCWMGMITGTITVI